MWIASRRIPNEEVENVRADREVILAVDDALGAARFSEARNIAWPYAEAGHPWAEACLGTLYLFGLGVEADVVSGVSYLSRAAEKGHGGAWYALGQYYISGGDDGPDVSKSEECFRKARELGYVPGMPLPGVFD
jgi:TPR repeat protein